MTYKTDYLFGKQKEEEILKIINNKFKDNIRQIINKYEKFDYEGDKYIYELKSRNCNYSTYSTTLLPMSKTLNNEKRAVFLFNFIDGLYYIKFREKKFKTFVLQSFCRNKREDITDYSQLYYYIPIQSLRKIEF